MRALALVLLAALSPVSFLLAAPWVCSSARKESCYVRPMRATTEAKERGVALHPALDKDGYSGVYRIGPMTASPPAVPVK